MPEISIIMPVKNAKLWVEETISSIIAQSYTDWELICIDDGSTDNTPSILHSFSQKDQRLIIQKNESKGIIPALQQGLKSSSGIYISRMDADDIMPKDRLSVMIDSISNSAPNTIVTGKVKYFSNELVSDGYIKYQNWLNERIELKDHWAHIYRECVIASPNWLARKSEIVENDIFKELRYPEDYSMCFQWFNKGFSIHSIPKQTLLWREHPRRTSRNSDIYDQPSFFDLKLQWFDQLNPKGSIAILGAGPKGKLSVRTLQRLNRQLGWYDLNHDKYNTSVESLEINDYQNINEDFLLMSIYPENRKPLQDFIESKGYEIGKNAWYL